MEYDEGWISDAVVGEGVSSGHAVRNAVPVVRNYTFIDLQAMSDRMHANGGSLRPRPSRMAGLSCHVASAGVRTAEIVPQFHFHVRNRWYTLRTSMACVLGTPVLPPKHVW